jgi:putative Mg2+ transporter-C (MgtC) family protein
MQFLMDALGEDGQYIARLLTAMLLGGLIGLERQTRGRSAGLRTNILVCLGSAATVVAFDKLARDMGLDSESVIRMDPARVAAGVITGIGFLGAGTIVKSKDFVRGLTTAASIWVVSAVGVTAGLGQYRIATSLTILVLITLFALHRLPLKADRYSSIRLGWQGDLQLLEGVIERLVSHNVHINHRSMTRQPQTQKCRVTLYVRFRDEKRGFVAFNELQDDQRFDEVSWS